jgi:general secretion pathway protein K
LGSTYVGGDEVRGKQNQRQRGAAILVAMLVVTLVATLAAGLQWRQWRLQQSEAASRAQSQASWVLVGALDWARLILREDARSAGNSGLMDHLGEPWALPLQEAKMSSFLSAEALTDAGQDEAYLSGSIVDAQSKINLTNLALNQTGESQMSKPAFEVLARLYEQLGLPPAELKTWVSSWMSSQPGATSKGDLEANTGAPLRPVQLEQLTWLGLPSSSLEKLRPYITILPQRTPVNLNTASALVIYAAVPGIDLAAAQKLVQTRSSSPLKSVSDAQSALGSNAVSSISGGTDFSVFSQYFEVRGRVRLGDWAVQESSLVHRDGLNVRTIWRRKV